MAVEVTYAQFIGRMNARPAVQDSAAKRRASRLVAAHGCDLTSKSKLRKLTEVERPLSAANFWWANDRCGPQAEVRCDDFGARKLPSDSGTRRREALARTEKIYRVLSPGQDGLPSLSFSGPSDYGHPGTYLAQLIPINFLTETSHDPPGSIGSR